MNFNDLYISDSRLISDYAPSGIEIKRIAYTVLKFFNNNIVKRKSIHLEENEKLDLSLIDFKDSHIGEYLLNNNLVQLIFDKGKDWELKETFIVEELELICIETNASQTLKQVYFLNKE